MAKAKKKFSEIGKEIGSAIDVEIEKDKSCEKKEKHHYSGGGAVYGMGLIGALIYFIGHATGFWMGVLGVLKAVIWPVLVVYKALGVLGL